MRRSLAGWLLLVGLLGLISPAEAASDRSRTAPASSKLDPLALVPDPTVVALAAQTAITGPAWTITASATGVGRIVPSGAVSVRTGASQTFVMDPDFCSRVTSVVVDGVEQGPVTSYAFTNVTSAHTIVATFEPNPPDTVRTSVRGGGRIEPSGDVVLACGSTQTFQIISDTCSLVGDVFVDGQSVGAVIQYTFTNIQTSHRLEARFVSTRQYLITASAGAGGKISPAGSVAVACGGDQTFAVLPDSCFEVADVLVDDVSQGPIGSYTFTNVRAAHRIIASFVRSAASYPITASAGPGGSITPAGTSQVDCGLDQTYDIVHDPCHATVDVRVDGVSRGPLKSYTFARVGAPHTIEASFAPRTHYTITASADPGLGISPSGALSVACGADLAFSINGGECGGSYDVIVDGVSQGTLTSFAFTNVNDDHTIEVRALVGPELFAAADRCGFGMRRPVLLGGPFPANRQFSVAAFQNDCADLTRGTRLDSVGTVHTGPDGFIDSSVLPCLPGTLYLVVIDILGNGAYDPACDAATCYEVSNPTGIAGIQGLEATLTVEGPEVSWWLGDPTAYRGFRIHRSTGSGEESLLTPELLQPPAGRPPVHMSWRDVSALPGTSYSYRVEALRTAGSDWFGPVTLELPGVARRLAFLGATPNPFSAGTRLALELPAAEPGLQVDVFDIAGRHVRDLHRGAVPAGRSVVDWDGRDDAGAPVRAGLYVVRLRGVRGSHASQVVKVN